MFRKSAAFLTAIALCASASAQAATRRSCINSAELHAMVAYFLPPIIDKVTLRCSAYAPASSYMRAGLPGLQMQLQQSRDANWPLAKSAFFKFAGPNGARDMARLADADLRPMVDETMAGKFDFALDAEKCMMVNDVTEALAPLNAMQSVHLIATILSVAKRNDNSIPTCPRGI